jgi:rRNA maturation RNase YbeY
MRRLKVNVYSASVRAPIPRRKVLQIAELVLQEENRLQSGELSLIFVDDDYIQELNSRFFMKDRPTDVIAFPLEEDAEAFLGEVYISIPRAAEQAAFYGVSEKVEVARLVIHGLLHLSGYRDTDPDLRYKMKLAEDRYLNRCFN